MISRPTVLSEPQPDVQPFTWAGEPHSTGQMVEHVVAIRANM